jgi:hypothetical protein
LGHCGSHGHRLLFVPWGASRATKLKKSRLQSESKSHRFMVRRRQSVPMRTLFGLFLLLLTVIAVDGALHEYLQRLQPSSVDAGAVRSCFSSGIDLCAGAIEESTVHQPVVLTAAASGLIVDDDHHPQPGIAFRNTHCAAPCACPPKPCWVSLPTIALFRAVIWCFCGAPCR